MNNAQKKPSQPTKSQQIKHAVLFDLDGTLVDTAADFVATVNHMLTTDGLEPIAPTLIRNSVSDGSGALVKLAYNITEEDDDFDKKRQQLLNIYATELGNNAALFDGMTALIHALEQEAIAWGIVTNKPERFTTPLLAKLNINTTDNTVICPDHVHKAKPHPEALLLAAKQLQREPQHCIYIGDHQRDIQAAQAANMTSIACAYGYISANDNIKQWQADYICHDTEDLNQTIFKYIKEDND